MARINKDEVRRLCELSKLELSDDELDVYASEIEAIKEFVDLLQSVDVDDYAPTDQVSGLSNVMRADELQELPSAETLLRNMHKIDNQFKVPRVL